jgi:hypothetical protein
MKRLEQAKHNQLIINKITRTVSYSYRIASQAIKLCAEYLKSASSLQSNQNSLKKH